MGSHAAPFHEPAQRSTMPDRENQDQTRVGEHQRGEVVPTSLERRRVHLALDAHGVGNEVAVVERNGRAVCDGEVAREHGAPLGPRPAAARVAA